MTSKTQTVRLFMPTRVEEFNANKIKVSSTRRFRMISFSHKLVDQCQQMIPITSTTFRNLSSKNFGLDLTFTQKDDETTTFTFKPDELSTLNDLEVVVLPSTDRLEFAVSFEDGLSNFTCNVLNKPICTTSG